ncbi:MAG: VWA domain-containing protein [Pseudomonadota bacterium]
MITLPDLAEFHFIRPLWLLLIPLALMLWFWVRRSLRNDASLPEGIAPHLAEALSVGSSGNRKIMPIDGVVALVVLGAVAAAGPTWSRIPNPFVAQTAPLVIALKVTKSMEETDLKPSRLDRAKHKIMDLVTLRRGARTALIAFAGTAHRVAPLTEDPSVLKPFLDGLSPDVMPKQGSDVSAALALASDVLTREENPGSILFVLDELTAAGRTTLDANGQTGAPVLFLAASAGGAGALEQVSSSTVTRITADDQDVRELDRRITSAYRDALANDDRQKWEDRGWMLAWPAALLTLIWFRRGWTMRWSVVLIAAISSLSPVDARADGIADWFFTPDQQGRLAFDDKRFAEAGALFSDPMWQGYALYRAGKYEEAAEVLGGLDTPEAAFAEGMARIKSRGYRPAIAAFEKALERDPEMAAAKRNLDIARAILDYVETAREQSDTGEEAGIGADDTVYDNESGRGTETTVTGDKEDGIQTADQWMRTVDTRTSDFLKSRFALEAAGGEQ